VFTGSPELADLVFIHASVLEYAVEDLDGSAIIDLGTQSSVADLLDSHLGLIYGAFSGLSPEVTARLP
jgi:hypothetical protein